MLAGTLNLSLYDEARRELRRELWRSGDQQDDMIQEYVAQRLAGVPPVTARSRAARLCQPRKYAPKTMLGLARPQLDPDEDEREIELPSVFSSEPRPDLSPEILNVLRRLPADQRRAISLRYEAGLSPTEIARETGWSISKVDRLLARARTSLSSELPRTA